ncbi:hypothetical protein FPV67DRAFT_1430865 [Lyophyllum atratum]|nr:hypothetical protein FPV67DRAFT_1430985 [Lyophyllum atratum]KAF8057058.1 hypothetical protein FPV67DRAFT_1430865 [Lyophyllum atratum]
MKKQKKLNFASAERKEFSREEVLHAVAVHVAVDNQVSIYLFVQLKISPGLQALMLADKITFRNVLVAMRPQAKKIDLPSAHDVGVYIHNAFCKGLEKLKADIEVRYCHL